MLRLTRPSRLLSFALLVMVLLGTLPSRVAAQPSAPPDGRIVGGALATAGQFPWQVALLMPDAIDGTYLFNAQFCGGSILSADWIVTAAHCMVDQGSVTLPADVVIGAGFINLNNPGSGLQLRDVSGVYVHPDYDEATTDNDIALLRLSTPLTLNNRVRRIVLTTANEATTLVAHGKSVTVSGWGALAFNGNYPPRLRFVSVPVVRNTRCNQLYTDGGYPSGSITANMICAGLLAGGKDSCQGDSGGPLVARKLSGAVRLVGIVSWGEGCAEPGFPGVYTRISNYLTWISDTQAANP